MGHTHGFTMNDKIRTCTKCNQELPNTNEFFNYVNKKTGQLSAVCKKCTKIIAKERNEKIKEQNRNKSLFYEGSRKCKKCGRDLPNNKLYFPIDYACKDGLRNICRECSDKESGFLDPNYNIYEKWSVEELELLKRVYSDYTGKELIEKYFPNRTIRSLECQAHLLGVSGKSEEAYHRGRECQSKVVSEIFKGRKLSDVWRKKLSDSKKQYYQTHQSWWKGKKRSQEQCKQISQNRLKQGYWKGNTNPRHINPLCGNLNGRWKGGILPFYTELRSDTKDWFKESIKFCEYKCVITGKKFDNCHHTTAFYNIVDEAFELSGLDKRDLVSDYTIEEFNLLRDVLKQLHVQYGYGACINKDVHKLFHDNYGYKNFSPYDFLSFCYRIDSGEFDDWFLNNNLIINLNYKYIEYLENILSKLFIEEQVS